MVPSGMTGEVGVAREEFAAALRRGRGASASRRERVCGIWGRWVVLRVACECVGVVEQKEGFCVCFVAAVMRKGWIAKE